MVTLREMDRKSIFMSLNWCHVRRVDSRQASYGVQLTMTKDVVVSFPTKLDRTAFGKSLPVSSCAVSWTSLSDLRLTKGTLSSLLRFQGV